MPNRNVEGDYRYAFQGQEKDGETGMEAFELRLWDSRIGRWLTTDPAGQYASPYLGMGNDPVNGIDPDGGYKTKWGRFWGWANSGFQGKFWNNPNADDPNKRYGVIQEMEGVAGWNVWFDHDGWVRANLDEWSHQIIDAGLVDINSKNLGRDLSRFKQSQFNKALSEAAHEHLAPVKAGYEMGLVGSGWGTGVRVTRTVSKFLKNTVDLTSDSYRSFGRIMFPVKDTKILKTLKGYARGEWLKVYDAAKIDGVKTEVHFFKHSKSGMYFQSKVKYPEKTNYWSRQFRKGKNKVIE